MDLKDDSIFENGNLTKPAPIPKPAPYLVYLPQSGANKSKIYNGFKKEFIINQKNYLW